MKLPRHPLSGPHNPTTATPLRRPGSIRRTSTVDALRPDGLTGRLVLRARARDLVTPTTGDAIVLGQARVDAAVDFLGGRRLLAIAAEPATGGLDALVGAPVSSGFRGRVTEARPDIAASGSLLHVLLDDLPGAVLVSGYAMTLGGAPRPDQPPASARADICAGWRRGGTLLLAVEQHGRSPAFSGPVAPDLSRDDDPLAWHAMKPLGPHGMRRRRRLDLVTGDPLTVDVMFRDSHVDDDGAETIVHEYATTVTLDARSLVIRAIEADPRVLPWLECPDAAPSARRLVGQTVHDLRHWVRGELTGNTTCTHLNDQLRSLEDVATLVELVDSVPADRTVES